MQESANAAVELARKVFPDVECKWGEEGLDEIIKDSSITGVAVVLAGQFQASLYNSLSRNYQLILFMFVLKILYSILFVVTVGLLH